MFGSQPLTGADYAKIFGPPVAGFLIARAVGKRYELLGAVSGLAIGVLWDTWNLPGTASAPQAAAPTSGFWMAH